MRKINLMNQDKRNAKVALDTLKYELPYEMGLKGKTISFKRYLACTDLGTHEAIAESNSEDYGQVLIETDPEIDVEKIGTTISGTDVVYLSNDGTVMYSPPKILESIIAPDGTEKERRDPQDVPGNVAEELPVRWTGKKLDKKEAVLKFVFQKSIQIKHTDGLTFDFLHSMAKELQDENALVFLGAGSKGKDPLIFQANGTPYRGFLEGRVDGDKYKLLLHLSNMELKSVVKAGGK